MRIIAIGGEQKDWLLLYQIPSLHLLAIYHQKEQQEESPLPVPFFSPPLLGEAFQAVDYLLELEPVPHLVQTLQKNYPHSTLIPASVTAFFLSIFTSRGLTDIFQSGREMEVIINSTHDGMVAVDGKGRITLFNRAAERMTGLKARDSLRRKVTEVIPNTRLHRILETGEEELNQLQKMDQVTIITNRVPVRDDTGSITGAVAVFRDITEVLSLAEELTDLREIHSLLEAIINATQDAISVVDEQGLGILINPAYTRLTGLTEEDVIGQPATVDIAEGESMHFKVLKEKKPITGSRMKVGPRKKEVIVDVAPITVGGELKGSVGVIHDVSEIKRLTEELDQAKRLIRELRAKYTFDDIIGVSEEIQRTMEEARRAAKTPVTVLLRGESGTGKELFAHAIHNSSARAQEQFIRVNCNAISSSLLESELFGYEGGAFTGALRSGKKGYFQEASGGTIFLDEVGKMDKNLQAKLLRVLQEKELLPVGGSRPRPVDVRVIVATNSNLEEAIRTGEFREDLYYRLNVFPIVIPPLRKRKGDIPSLVHYLIRKLNQEYGRSVKSCSREALAILCSHNWRGNIRELENTVGRAMINLSSQEDVITSRHLPILQNNWNLEEEDDSILLPQDLKEFTLGELLAKREEEIIQKALEFYSGNRSKTAQLLGISLRSLYYKLRRIRR